MPRQTLFKRFGTDNLKNGIYLGAIMGLLVYFGEGIIKFITELVPESLKFFGQHSTLFYLIIIGAIIGYYVDRN